MQTQEVNQIKRMVTNDYSGKLLYVTISGSHLYGFESSDSDIDFRGCWLVDTNKLLGLKIPRDYIERVDGLNDTVLFELRKEIGLLNKGNCNVLEHLFANQLYTSDEYFELKKIIQLNLNIAGVYHSYRGMAWENYNKFCLKGMHTVKKFLYVFRAILAGIHAIETRSIEPNLEKLLIGRTDSFVEPIQNLIRLKKQGKEKDFLPDSSLARYHKLVEYMMTIIDSCYEKHKLSEKIQLDLDHSRELDLDRFLKKVRKNYMRKNNGE
jgi:predicted nucleotidyltransferase